MKILTININSIRARIESFMRILESGVYDVVCVQELKVPDADFPHSLFEFSGYNIKVFGQKSYNGVAIFSKLSIEDVVRGMPNYPDANARFIECVIDGRFRLINVYMPNGEHVDSAKFPYKIEWMTKFSEYIYKYEKSPEPVIICGDFNVAIEDRDVYSPKDYEGSSISAPAARKIMNEWLARGWTDQWRRLNGDNVGYTWFGYRPGSLEKNKGLRLDYFLTNEFAGQSVKNCRVDMTPRLEERPTDHAGLVLEI